MTGLGRWAVAAVVLLFAARLHLMMVEAYDPDEFEHLHVGLSIARGQVVYRDFFEHHGPLPYALAAPFARLLGGDVWLLTVNRCLSLVFVGLCVWGVARLSRRIYGAGASTPAVLWLLTLPAFVDKSLEWRPDVPAMTAICWAAVFAAEGGPAACGLLLAAATLCTQKTAFLVAGVGVAALLSSPRSQRSSVAMAIAAGFLAPWFFCCQVFQTLDAVEPFARCVFLYPLIWPMKVSVGKALFTQALFSGPAALLIGVAAWVRLWIPSIWLTSRPAPEGFVRWPCLLHWAMLPLVPAAYLQFHLLGLPLLAVAVGGFLSRWWKSVSFRCAMLVLYIPTIGWFYLHHVDLPNVAPDASGSIVTRAQQVAWINEIRQYTGGRSKVQDGYTGYGCLRQHVGYWWWINEHSLALAERLGQMNAVREQFTSGEAALVILDRDSARVAASVETAFRRLYREPDRRLPAQHFLYMRRSRPTTR